MPEAAENVAALAKAWREGEVDLSNPMAIQPVTKPRPVIKGFAWTTLVVVLTLSGVWAANNI